MPGLAIIINRGPKEENKLRLQQMVNSMKHESFYSTGAYDNENAGVYVGWSCQPGSYCDCMPIRNEKNDLLLFFYGEHHADPEDLQQLRCRGHSLPEDNAAYVLHLFEEQGCDFLKSLNGWFHGALLDLAKQEILIFNDRFGMQRLYYWEKGETALFASEAKALLSAVGHLRKLDPRGLAEYVTCGCVLENRTLFSGLRALPAASAWTYKRGGLKKEGCYFQPDSWETTPVFSAAEFEQRLKQAMPRIVNRYLQSDLPLGISLTGGYDTRLIMAFMNEHAGRIPSYTFGGMYRECFDVRIARRVAEICQCKHQVLNLDSRFLNSFAALAEKTVFISDGHLGACNAYELYLNRLARSVAPVRLTGSYGSEVMRQARAFKAVSPTPGLMHPDFKEWVETAIGTFDQVSRCHSLTFSLYKQAPWQYFNRLAVEQSQVVVRTPYMDKDLIALVYRAGDARSSGKELTRRLIMHGNPALALLPTDTGNASWLRTQAAQFLFKADYCYKSGMPQWLERMHYLAGPFQPERLIRGIHRFQHFRIWFRNELAPYVREILLDPRTGGRPYVNRTFVETMVGRHLKGTWNYTDDIEKVLSLELAHRLFIDG
jgi:asparagine synthase (glutamine-hydrolysing)